MKHITNLFSLPALGLLISSAHAATLSATSDNPEYNVNDIVTVSIDGSAFTQSADSVGLTLSWDPTIIAYSSISFDNPPWDTTFFNNDNVATGRLDTVFAGSASGAGTDFALADITFTALALGSTEVLISTSGGGCVAGACGVFSEGTALLTDYTPANVNVVPIPAAVWLFGTGLVGLFGMARKIA
jgi:hypothetical protein